MSHQLEPRLQGALRPDTVLTITDDGVTVDTTAYTWTITGAPSTTRKVAWTKAASGIVATAGGVLTIGWLAGDLGACTIPTDKQQAVWELELVGVLSGVSRKYTLTVTILRTQTP